MTEEQKNLSRIIKNWARKIPVEGTKYTWNDKKLEIVKCPPYVPFPKGITKYASEIEVLDINDMQIHEESIKIIEKLTSLTKLSLNKVSFTGRPFSEWRYLNNISELKLNAVSITELPDWLSKLKNLKLLHISNAAIKKLPSEALNNLESLCISNTQIEELPETSKILQLKTLNISNTKISKIPDCYLPQSLEKINMQWCNMEEVPEKISSLEKLESINLADLKIEALPTKMASASKIKRIDISNTHIEKLPDWIQQTGKLEFLGLNRCKLKSISKEIISHLSERNFKNEQGDSTNKDHKGIYIKQLELEDMDVRNFKKNNKELIKALIDIEELNPSREMKIIVMGDQGVGKTTVIRHILDEDNGNDFMISACGLQAVDETVEINAYRPEIRLDNDTHITVWELSSEPAVQLLHPMFMTDESLYIIVLDARKVNELYQRAKYWIHFIEKQAVNASVIFILTHAEKKERDYLNTQLIEVSSNLRIHEGVCRFFTDEVQQIMEDEDDAEYDIEKNVLKLRETLIHAIKEMPMYSMKIPSSWKRIKRHSQSLLEARNLISYQRFEDVCRYYGVKDEKIMKALAKWLCEAGVAIIPGVYGNNTPKFIYNVLWIAKGMYSIALFSNKYIGNKKMTIRDLINVFEDEASDDYQDYTAKNIQTMIEIFEDNKLCYTTKDDELIFPHACSLMDSDYSKKDKKNSEKTVSEWVKDIRENQDTNHYIIKCSIMTADLLSSIIVMTRDFYLNKFENDEQKLKASEHLLIGREGILIPFSLPQNGTLIVLGNIGCPSELHIYASLVNRAIAGDDEQKKVLKEYADIALKAFDESIKQLPEADTYKFEKYIVEQQNDKETLVSFDDLLGYLSLGMSEYRRCKCNMEYNMEYIMEFNTYELAYRYLLDKYWKKENN